MLSSCPFWQFSVGVRPKIWRILPAYSPIWTGVSTISLKDDGRYGMLIVMRSGAFAEPAFGEFLEEEGTFAGSAHDGGYLLLRPHPSNVQPKRGILPRDKEGKLNAVRETRIRMEGKLDEYPIRAGEGGIINRRSFITGGRKRQSMGGTI